MCYMSPSDLQQFLGSVQDKLQSDSLSKEQYKLLLQFFTKYQAVDSLKGSEKLEDKTDFWDYLSLGLYIYEFMLNDECSAQMG